MFAAGFFRNIRFYKFYVDLPIFVLRSADCFPRRWSLPKPSLVMVALKARLTRKRANLAEGLRESTRKRANLGEGLRASTRKRANLAEGSRESARINANLADTPRQSAINLK